MKTTISNNSCLPLVFTTQQTTKRVEADGDTPQRPLRTKFIITSMPVGGAETLLVNLIRGFRESHIVPSVVCLKDKGPLGTQIANEFPVESDLLRSKYDVSIAFRLAKLLQRDRTDAVVTVGAGDKMFWGRIAAKLAGVPVVCSALHSTGWPDGVGRLNRQLTPITDAFIAVAKSHGRFLVEHEKFPQSKVFVIPNGVDTNRFIPQPEARLSVRAELGLSTRSQLIGIVAALRPEKNHELFIKGACRIKAQYPDAHFLIVGEGPERSKIEQCVREMKLTDSVHLLGNRSDTARILASLDAFALTSHNEASPVSILEALSCQVPVVATNVGSVAESVIHQWNGFTIEPGDETDLAERLSEILASRDRALELGHNGRDHVIKNGSLTNMVRLYEELIHRLFDR